MDPIAHYALTGSIVASALGGIALCALVILYGFFPPEDESAERAQQRVFAVRLGHTVAAVCFAATALLSVVALSRLGGPVDVSALDTRISAVERLVEKIAASMETLVSRIERGERESASPSTATESKSNPAR